MKARIKFIKTGSMRFLGHLDVMRYFQKAFRRSGTDILYSGGYSPHQLISFASPLGLGLTSEGEYMDAQFGHYEEPEKLLAQINEAMNEEIRVTDMAYVPDTAKPSMALTAASDYLLSARKEMVRQHFSSQQVFLAKFQEFLGQDKILFEKKSKKTTQTMDLKPFIYAAGSKTEGKNQLFWNPGEKQFPISEAEWTDLERFQEIHLLLRLSCGSIVNIKPEQVLEAFYSNYSLPFEKLDWNYHRIELYADRMENTKESLEERIGREKDLVTLLDYEKEGTV